MILLPLSLLVAGCDRTPPSFPEGAALAAQRHEATLTLSWPAATDDDEVAAYVVFDDARPLGESTTTTFDLEGPRRTTLFRVRARDASGNVGEPVSLRVTPFDRIAPRFPTRAQLDLQRDGDALVLGWPSANDDIGVVGYVVTIDGQAMSLGEDQRTWRSPVADDATVDCSVVALDAAGNRSDALTARAIPGAVAPSAAAVRGLDVPPGLNDLVRGGAVVHEGIPGLTIDEPPTEAN